MSWKIDASNHLTMLEQVLREGLSRALCDDALAVLRRWQHDEHLTEASRQKARALLREFGGLNPY